MFNEKQKRLNKIIKKKSISDEMPVCARFFEIEKMKKLEANVV